jgi:hypothetical protein
MGVFDCSPNIGAVDIRGWQNSRVNGNKSAKVMKPRLEVLGNVRVQPRLPSVFRKGKAMMLLYITTAG